MFDIKAFLAGCIAVIVVGLTLQLCYVLLASFISTFDSGDGFFSTWQTELWFAAAMLVYALTMFIGGLICGLLSNRKPALTSALVGLSTSLFSLLTSSTSGNITWLSVLMIIGSVVFCLLGNRLIQKHKLRRQQQKWQL